MEVQTECAEPPAAPPSEAQPTGKINKAAFKLFGKRRSGSGMAGFFSFRNKGASGTPENGSSSANGNSSTHGGSAAELVRSKTHDGLTNAEAERQRGEEPGGLEAGPVRSLSKSLSFFSLFRRGSGRAAAENGGGSGFGRRGRGLKGLFSSMRWRRRDRAIEAPVEVLEAKEAREGDARGPEEGKDVTLTLEPPPPQCEEARRGSEMETAEANAAATPPHSFTMATAESPPPYTPIGSPVCGTLPAGSKAAVSGVRATPPLEHCGAGTDPPSEPSVDRLCSLLFTDVTSLKSFDSLTGCGDIIADAEEEGVGPGGSGTSSSSSGGNAGANTAGSPRGRIAATTSRVSPVKVPAHVSAPFPLPTFAPTPSPASLPSRARVAPPPPHPAGSGVVAYMGGGEEMASPEGVDDADMQGLWHMLPSTGDNSPALPRTQPNPAYPSRSASNPARGAERRAVQVKALGLSKIPVVGSGGRAGKPPLPPAHARHATSPYDKEALSDEGYWDTPTATPTATPDEGGLQRNQGMGLSRDSCSGDHLYDLYNDPEEDQEEGEGGEEDLTSTPSPSTDCKLSPGSQVTPPSSTSSSSFRSVKGSASLPRDSKIPVSARQNTPPHSVSQTALSSVLEADSPPPKTETTPTARTRIPVSKVPVRRPGNKPGNATRGSAHRK